ncbi:anti-sigma factor family protein [Saccharothrix hoggarensis]|uniref:Anti-sigma factor family protein n=1 Tax=Saccharothrix hoggarensis TaxID=913853 RepID=A0ABW3QUT7_9PSEU
MTGNARRSGPPWSVDLLADLHAGVLDPQTEAELRPLVDSDPEARAVLAALDATLEDLRNLPPIPMPREVAERIDKALAEEARPAAPVIDFNQAKARRAKRLGWGAGLLAAAAAAVGIAVVVIPSGNTPGDNVAQPDKTTTAPAPGATPPGATGSPGKLPAVRGENFGPVFGDVLKAQNYGPLENQEQLADCLRGANIQASKPLGVSPITLNDRNAVMAILPAGSPGAYRIVVVDPETCGPDNPDGVLANTTIEP